MMAVLEDAGLVVGRYEQQIIDGQILRERHYKVTPLGKTAWRQSRDFYMRVSATVRTNLPHGT